MTAVDVVPDEDVDVESDDSTETEDSDEGAGAGRKRDRDFSKFRDTHQELADFINANEDYLKANLPPISPNQVKAITTLRTDFTNTPEQVAAREERKAAKAAEASKYEGMTEEQIKQVKAAEKVEKQAAKLRARFEEAVAKAQAIREGKEASGADLAATVEAAQNGNGQPEEEVDASPRRRIGRNR